MAEQSADLRSPDMKNPNVHGLIGWFATNHVAANLLMIAILAAGVYVLFDIKKETMPDFQTDQIRVGVNLRGGSPEEVENTIIVKIENALRSVQGIEEIRSYAGEGGGSVRVSVTEGEDVNEVRDRIKAAVDGISSFPTDMDPPSITADVMGDFNVINVQVSGDIDEASLKELTESLRNEVLALEEVSYADVMGARPYEITIEVSEETLQQYGLTMEQIAQRIRSWSVDLSGGSIRSSTGDMRVRAKGQSYTGEEFGEVVLLTNADGTRLKLSDIATINDGFAETDFYAFFNRKRSMGISAYSRLKENEIEIANAVKEWAAERNKTLPESVTLTAWADSSYYLKGRMTMMLKNLGFGALLVFVMLGIFLRLRIAAWVVIGLPVAFLGALAALPVVDITINVISLFGFIVVIGIVVDDAIIIAESADAETHRHGYNVENIVRGAQRVAVPATFGVLTTVAAFAPLLYSGGRMSAMNSSIGWVVVMCLLFSLVESKLILPSHLALMHPKEHEKKGLADWVDGKLKAFVDKIYLPSLRVLLEYRYATAAFFVAMLIFAVGLVMSGVVRQTFFPEFESDFIMAEVTLVEGASEELLDEVIEQIDGALQEVHEELKAELGSDEDIIKNVFGFVQGGSSARFQVELAKSEDREVSPSLIGTRWREKTGNLAGTEELKFRSRNSMGSGAAISLALRGSNVSQLEAAAQELTDYLMSFDGLYEVQNQAQSGPPELKLKVTPEGEAAGLTLSSLARQVRQAFYGYEVQRIQRGESEIRVMVRYPPEERKSIGNLESMWVSLPDGSRAPFYTVASYEEDVGYSSINRLNGKRTLEVTAEVNYSKISPPQVLTQARSEFLPALVSQYPSVEWALSGTSMEERMGLNALAMAFAAALTMIYALMAVPLKSYLQPLIIMSVIPFGIIGAILGHLIVGQFTQIDFNMVSMIGCIALSGVVVNDSLILVHYVNRKIQEGDDLVTAILRSGKARFRAILLTSFTTFFGLVPILLERSLHAKLIIPMAVSIAFGIVFATLITLVLIPTLLRVCADAGWRRYALIREKPSRDESDDGSLISA